MPTILSLEPVAADLYGAIQRCRLHLAENFGFSNGLILLIGVESYVDLIALTSHAYGQLQPSYATGGLPHVRYSEFEGMKVVVDPTRGRFVCVIPADTNDSLCFATTRTVPIPQE